MSVFVIKLLAVCSMVIDHLGSFLRPQISSGLYTLMRSIGRFAFPVYCFLIVNGSQKTHDVKHYLTRLIAFAVISQLPFALAEAVHMLPAGSELVVSLGSRWFVCLIFILVAGVTWYTTVRADWSVLWPVLALVLAVLRVEYAGIPLLSGKLNVFYTLALGLAVISLLEAALKPERDMVRLLLQGIALFGAFFLIGDNSDYGILGVALIVAIWAGRDSRFSQAGVMTLWCVVKFLVYGNLVSRFIGAICCLIPVLLYNGKQGRPLKLAFYAVYPLHLAAIGTVTVYHLLT